MFLNLFRYTGRFAKKVPPRLRIYPKAEVVDATLPPRKVGRVGFVANRAEQVRWQSFAVMQEAPFGQESRPLHTCPLGLLGPGV